VRDVKEKNGERGKRKMEELERKNGEREKGKRVRVVEGKDRGKRKA